VSLEPTISCEFELRARRRSLTVRVVFPEGTRSLLETGSWGSLRIVEVLGRVGAEFVCRTCKQCPLEPGGDGARACHNNRADLRELAMPFETFLRLCEVIDTLPTRTRPDGLPRRGVE